MTKDGKAKATIILRRFADRLTPDTGGRAKAVRALVDDLVALNGVAGFKFERVKESKILASYGPHGVRVKVEVDGRVGCVRFEKRQEAENVGEFKDLIEYEPGVQALVGIAEDDSVEPVPGSPKPRRKALSVLLEAVGEAIVKVGKGGI